MVVQNQSTRLSRASCFRNHPTAWGLKFLSVWICTPIEPVPFRKGVQYKGGSRIYDISNGVSYWHENSLCPCAIIQLNSTTIKPLLAPTRHYVGSLVTVTTTLGRYFFSPDSSNQSLVLKRNGSMICLLEVGSVGFAMGAVILPRRLAISIIHKVCPFRDEYFKRRPRS
jgi:hypothetical protein